MAKENLNESISKLVTSVNKAFKDMIEAVGDAVEDNPVAKKQSWEDLAARGQRIASKWTEGKGESEGSGPFESIRSNFESQFETMPRRARERTFKTLAHLAGVVDDLTNLGHNLEASPEAAASLTGHGLRPPHGPIAIRRAAGTSCATESAVGARRRIARQWLNDE